MTLAFDMPGTVESVVKSRSNGQLIAAAAALHIDDGDTVLDMTYGRGNFWTVYRPATLIAHDIRIDGVDFRELPELDESVDVVVFDPPYIVVGGIDTSTIDEFGDRYGVIGSEHAPTSIGELERLFDGGIGEAARVLRHKGRLLVKCMDFVSGGRYQALRHYVVNAAVDEGFRQVDEFVHYSGTGPQPRIDVQRTSRRAHSFLCVFERWRP